MGFITKAAVFVIEVEEFLPLDHGYGGHQGVIGGSVGSIGGIKYVRREWLQL